MVERLDINPKNIIVTHLAADDLLILQPSDEVADWVKKTGRYWIYPAKVWKHKNHHFLLNSLGKRCQELKHSHLPKKLIINFP